MFIMLDGIDGSGKSTIIETWKKYLREEGNALFDLRAFWKEHDRHPEYRELKPYDFILSAEPTSVSMGKVIREKMVKHNSGFSSEQIAEAYAEDRRELYEQLFILALQEGKSIIQDRGVSTSLCYQPVTGMSVKYLLELPGNALALQHRPDHLVLLKVEPQVALARIAARLDKQDNAIFERVDFLKKAADMFASASFRELFESHGTTVHYLPADQKIDILQEVALNLLKQILKK